jgi:hypothetical protein
LTPDQPDRRLRGFPEAINATFPQPSADYSTAFELVQTCIMQLLHNAMA